MVGLAGIFSIVVVLLWILSFVAGIWLIVVAFKRSRLWGLLTLLVPFAISGLPAPRILGAGG